MHAYMDTDIADSCADSYALQSVHCVCRMRWVWYRDLASTSQMSRDIYFRMAKEVR